MSVSDELVADSASELILQEADVSSSEEELLPSSEEPITSSPGTLPHSTIDGSSSSFPGAVGSASSEQLSTTSSSSVLHLRDTAEKFPPSASFVGPPILLCRPPNWYQDFYMRTDHKGYLQMYPDLGGPFGSLQEAEAAIKRHLDERRLPEMLWLWLHQS
ncbi:uncharacterized protein LOC120671028 isoform X3 [Panicum virgatum]|uniref:Uncharacterized protein n=1 Tax=Panicum virgatum TaxID=38727 RepID=A0A8T0SYW7_PANVG|nr:uncharacterized protein LOC120671028 isoform X3 [Panicum virgatum]KAG2604030.1 hypothetical protein PVAP13_4NG032401 [Panicum virgatum]